jgi:putative ABC transport system permease protein
MEEDSSMTDPFSSELDDSLIAEIEALGDVEMARGMSMAITDAGMVGGTASDAFDVYGFSIGFQDGEFYDDASDNEIVLGSSYAKGHDLVVGDDVGIYNKKYEVVGILESIGSAGDDNSLYMPLKESQKISGNDDTVMMIIAKAINIDDTENIANQIMSEFDDVTALSDKEMMRQIQDLMGTINIAIYAIGLISSIVAGIVIMNVMFMSVHERTTEIGAMKALGATNRQILSEILVESVSLSMIGGVLAVLLSFIIAQSLNSYLDTRLMAVTFRLICISLSYSAFLGALGGYIPARRAAKINPIEALRYE